MDFSNVKLIGIDLDGTLLHDDKSMSERTRNAIISASNKGIEVVPITGRPIVGIPDFIKNMKEINYIIYSNGSHILKNGESLCSFAMPNDKAKIVLKKLRELDCMFEVFSDGWGHIEQSVDDFFHTVIKEGTPIGDYIYGSRKIVPSIEEMLAGDKEVDEFFIICKDAETRQSLISSIEDIDGIHHWYLDDIFLEITNNGTNKGNALSALCDHLGIGLENTMAFGDAENDMSFLEKAGIAVAMDNAHPRVKSRADIITESNNNDGVAKIIEKI